MRLLDDDSDSLFLIVVGQIFEPFGPVELVQLPLDLETGHCKGFGFVQVSQNISLISYPLPV